MQLNMVSIRHLETKMGTYTTNYNLFMPSVGETGWGTLVNGNFSTIDSTMKSLSNRITAVENEVNGALACTSVTTSGKVTANGGLASTTGTFSGAVTGTSFNRVVLKSSGTITVTPNSTVIGYLPSHDSSREYDNQVLTLLPPLGGVKYTGSLRFMCETATRAIYYNGATGVQTLPIDANTLTTLSFTSIPFLTISGYGRTVTYYGYTLT